MSEVILSVLVPVYNHEKYIAQCLESILMQKTQYKFEVLVGEDCSTDNTRAIIEKYEKMNPGFFTVFYREHNMSKEEVRNGTDLRNRAKGKYITILEGDDYWISEEKIEKQVRFLEEHSEYFAVACNCVVVDEYGNKRDEEYPECKTEEYTFRDYANGIFPGQTATMMHYREGVDWSILKKGLTPGDGLKNFAIVINKRVFCMQECLSAYRKVYKGGDSYTANYKYDCLREERWYRAVVEYTHEAQKKEPSIWAEAIYMRKLLSCLRRRKLNVRDVREKAKIVEYPRESVFVFFKYLVKNKVFKIKIWY